MNRGSVPVLYRAAGYEVSCPAISLKPVSSAHIMHEIIKSNRQYNIIQSIMLSIQKKDTMGYKNK